MEDQPGADPPDSFALAALLAPGVTNLYLAPRSVPKVRVSAGRGRTAVPRARATVSSNGVEVVLACAPTPAENAIPTPLRLGRAVRPGDRASRTAGVWPPGQRAQAMRRTSQEILPCQPSCTALAGS